MQIQVHTDNHIEGSASLTSHVEDVVKDALDRFGSRITRVVVQLADENSRQKSGSADKRCTLEARLAGLQPISASHYAESLDQALVGAMEKLEKTLDRTLQRRDDPTGRTSFSGE